MHPLLACACSRSATFQFSSQEISAVQAGLVGHRIEGVVVGNEPQLLAEESQLLFCVMDGKQTLAQVRSLYDRSRP